jgi:DNA mismatch repair protein MutS2
LLRNAIVANVRRVEVEPVAPLLDDKTLADLEWHRIVRAVADRCVGPRRRILELPLAADEAGTARALAETREAAALAEAGDPLPLEGLRDIRDHLARAERMGTLEAHALLEVADTVAAARALCRFLAARRRVAPLLAEVCATDPSLDALEDSLRAALDADGTLADHASPELRALRTEVANLRGRIVARLEEMVVRHADVLSDRFHTIRDERYVLPVRSDAHERIPGIVHGTSASGATVFVEPRALVQLGNRLRLAQAEMEREVHRILAALSDRVREHLPALRVAADALDHADLRAASARLGRDLRCTFPSLGPPSSGSTDVSAAPCTVSLRRARHPILALDGVEVVPNDLELRSGHALVVSGPNAGGKTVALKTIGLAALMVRAGLPLPVADGSVCAHFDRVFTDVGDDQSLARNLSTFSAHVTNVAGILRLAGPRSLVLLDELAGGTDPEEGAALACAVVDALCQRGAAVVVTTHYEALKALALRDPRLRNASVGFDVATMTPTFHLMLDVPGASSALAVAARFGIPEDVLAIARRVLPDTARSFDELVRKLETEWRALAIQRSALESETLRVAERRSELERELAALRSRERARLSRETEQLLSIVRKTREEIREARARLRSSRVDEAELEAARRVVDAAAAKLALGGELASADAQEPSGLLPEPPAPPEPGAIFPGMRVYVPRLRLEAVVLEAPQRGRLRIAAGSMRVWVDVDEVRVVSPPSGVAESSVGRDPRRGFRASPVPRPEVHASGRAREPERRGDSAEATSDREPPLPPSHEGNTIDLRGMRTEDALSLLESFLDRLYGASEPVGFVVHGLGSGALREAVRAHLARPSPYVAHSRPGRAEEGGDRVTIVWMR